MLERESREPLRVARNYLTLKAAAVMQRLKDLNALPAPNN